MDEARSYFNAQVLEAFTDEVRGDGLATVAGLVGAFEGFGDGEPFVRRIGDHAVVDISPPRVRSRPCDHACAGGA